MSNCTMCHHFPTRILPSALAAASVFSISILSGCVGEGVRPCSAASLECIAEQQRSNAYRACMDDLFWNKQASRSAQKAISAAYGYPYTDAETYFRLARGGAALISPNEWCNAYASRRAAPGVPQHP